MIFELRVRIDAGEAGRRTVFARATSFGMGIKMDVLSCLDTGMAWAEGYVFDKVRYTLVGEVGIDKGIENMVLVGKADSAEAAREIIDCFAVAVKGIVYGIVDQPCPLVHLEARWTAQVYGAFQGVAAR